MILVNYLDNIITIINPKFQNLVTSITGKLLYVSGKKPLLDSNFINLEYACHRNRMVCAQVV